MSTHTHYQVDVRGTAKKVRLSGLPDSEWLALARIKEEEK
jgi:hypothetical protein